MVMAPAVLVMAIAVLAMAMAMARWQATLILTANRLGNVDGGSHGLVVVVSFPLITLFTSFRTHVQHNTTSCLSNIF